MRRHARRCGFTLIELMVVLAIIATLLALALPRYFSSLEKSREAALRHDLAVLRETLDKYYGDKGKYPEALDELVTDRYLRKVPVDPLTGSSATWITIPPDTPDRGGVYDVHSGADGVGHDGTEYQSW